MVKERGASMIEVLATLFMLTVGLMGQLGIHSELHKSSVESYQRTQAIVLINNMIERMNANRYSGPCYAISTGSGSDFLGTEASAQLVDTITCEGWGDVDTQAIAKNDLLEWDGFLKGMSAVDGNGQMVGAMLGARGCITLDSSTTPETYTVTIVWQGLTESVESENTCALGLFGTNTKRRVLSTTVQFAQLMGDSSSLGGGGGG
mgnify:CR=1 FL=1